MKKLMLYTALAVGLLLLVAHRSEARVVRFVVEQTRVIVDGKSWGDVGPYERLDGTAYFEVDPRDPLNAVIVNLAKAPKNAKGMVEFSSPFYILKPVTMSRGNRNIFYGINNRGSKIEYAWRTILPQTGTNNNNPLMATDFGDGLLLRLGYVYVDAGWQGNVAPGNERLVPSLPIAREANGKPIVAKVRIEHADAEGFTRPLEGSPNFRSYETADLDTTHASLTVRSSSSGPKTAIPSDQWAFGRCPTGKASLEQSRTDICLFDGFKIDKVYELIYPAKNPIVMGLGYAVTRDLASFLRYQPKDDFGNKNPLAAGAPSVGIRHAYGSGISSTGMYMRDWLYLGFNEDEKHRKVFDGVQVIIPGTHRLLANVEFADPNIYSRQDIWHDSISYSYPPLTYAVTTDPISGIRDGILKRPKTDPFVMHIDSANELWQMQGSLNVHDGQGKPAPIPANVRMYLAPSSQHGGVAGLLNPAKPAGICQSQTQGFGWFPMLRALLVAIDQWADRGVAPPPSNYPTLQDMTLVSIADAKAAFPAIPGVTFPTMINELALPDFGPDFKPSGGRLAAQAPTFRGTYQLFVPKPDRDGLDIGGIRLVEVAAPIATITGWNVRAAGHRAPELCALSGSYVAFPTTKAERQASGDPRLSLEERYGDAAGLLKAVQQASSKLVSDRFLLQEDADRYIKAARESDLMKGIAGRGL